MNTYESILECTLDGQTFRIFKQEKGYYFSKDLTNGLSFLPEDINWQEYFSTSKRFTSFKSAFSRLLIETPLLLNSRLTYVSDKFFKDFFSILSIVASKGSEINHTWNDYFRTPPVKSYPTEFYREMEDTFKTLNDFENRILNKTFELSKFEELNSNKISQSFSSFYKTRNTTSEIRILQDLIDNIRELKYTFAKYSLPKAS